MKKLVFYTPSHKRFVTALIRKIKYFYGKDLVSLAVYGSYARRENKRSSDIDLLIIVDKVKSKGRLKRQSDFVKKIEMPLQNLAMKCYEEGISTDISSFILTASEAAVFNPLYLDMTEHCMIIFDKKKFLKTILEGVRGKMKKWGSKKLVNGNTWCWNIQPHHKIGEPIDYDQ